MRCGVFSNRGNGSLWWESNASRNVRPVQQWPTSTKVKGPTASLSYHLSYPCELPRPATFKVSIDINGHCVVDWRKGSRGLV